MAASSVQEVMAALGIGSGAVRTALSRLCKDGWMERTRRGRSSYYRLSASGLQEFAAAATTIYRPPARPSDNTEEMVIIATHPDHKLDSHLRAQVVPLPGIGLYLAQAALVKTASLANAEHLVARLERTSLPDWVRQYLMPEKMADRYRALTEMIDQLADTDIASPLEALAIRTLLIHEWRRLRLRHPVANLSVAHTQTPDSLCHQRVADFYHDLNDAAEKWLDTEAKGPNGSLPVSDIVINSRFR